MLQAQVICTERLNDIVGALRGSIWHFIGPLRFNGDLFQCWVWCESQLYCCSYGKEWDAVVASGPGNSSGVWDLQMTAKLRAFRA
jgi:hypothetical protein